jgi:adenylate kinase
MEAVLSSMGKRLDCAVLMDVSFDILMQRLTGRRTCSKTGKLLNVYFSPQAELDACTDAGGELIERADDNEATIRNRLEVYERETAPLIDYYREDGRLRTVQAEGTPEEVYSRLVDVLAVE